VSITIFLIYNESQMLKQGNISMPEKTHDGKEIRFH
jgi:hypothetical protein